eukprot:TRINITY_DN89132_c0_g1_i1.p1 TRINITY_DN89132_c0_g1~~TRINITY_DN89132_c0_g1_i1.p1  ORF type:complete len:313 (+),score=35.41 TRINITY_DN89132_c0_g1_i1:96-941(+)
MEDHNSKVWFIRHACSIFNLWGRWYYKTVTEAELSPTELALVKSATGKFDAKFLDAPLCSLGESQALAAQSIMAAMPVKYVIVSPLERALETARIIFSTHPLKADIQFIVHPMIRECITNPDDIPNWTLKMQKEKYATRSGLKYDFGMLEKLHPGMYFLETVEEELKELAMGRIKDMGEEEYQKVMIELMTEKWQVAPKHHKYLESYSNARKRAKAFLEWLREFIKEKQVKASEIVVVSHMTFLQCLAAKEFDDRGIPVYPIVPNAQPFEIDIDELLTKYY